MPPPVIHSSLPRETGISGEIHTGRGIRKDVTLDSFYKPIVIEIDRNKERCGARSDRDVWIPTQSIIKRKLRAHFPSVCCVQPNVCPLEMSRVCSSFIKTGWFAEQEISHPQTRRLATEGKLP